MLLSSCNIIKYLPILYHIYECNILIHKNPVTNKIETWVLLKNTGGKDEYFT